MPLENCSVAVPGRFRALCKRIAEWSQDFAGFSNDLINPVDAKRSSKREHAVSDHRAFPAQAPNPSEPPAGKSQGMAVNGGAHDNRVFAGRPKSSNSVRPVARPLLCVT